MGWSYDAPGKRPLRIYSHLTTEMLYEQGFLDANFSDPRVIYGGCEIIKLQNIDGARHEHSPEIPKFQVWTSALGKQVLKDKGLLLDDAEKLRYHRKRDGGCQIFGNDKRCEGNLRLTRPGERRFKVRFGA